MDAAFGWIGDFIYWMVSFLPTWEVIHQTYGGVKWSGKKSKLLGPGVHWYWPPLSDIEEWPTNRRQMDLPTQTIRTADKETVVVNGKVIHRVSNVLTLLTMSEDPDATISDIAQIAIRDYVSAWKLDELEGDIAGTNADLTERMRKLLKPYGVNVKQVALSDLAPCDTIKLAGLEDIDLGYGEDYYE